MLFRVLTPSICVKMHILLLVFVWINIYALKSLKRCIIIVIEIFSHTGHRHRPSCAVNGVWRRTTAYDGVCGGVRRRWTVPTVGGDLRKHPQNTLKTPTNTQMYPLNTQKNPKTQTVIISHKQLKTARKQPQTTKYTHYQT